jgi:pimeloyl-ACP methyl ester carboxylesterase
MKKLVMKSVGIYMNTLSILNPTKLKKVGFELFCNPFSPKFKDYQMEFVQTSEMFDFEFDNKKIQAYKWGQGKQKVVLMHGWASNVFRWRRLIESMDKNEFTIYAFDAPGHGLSEGKMLHLKIYNSCLQHFLSIIEPIDSVVAHSFGGFAIIYHLFKQKSNISKIVVMGAPGEADDFFMFYKKELSLSEKTLRILKEKFIEELGELPSYFSTASFSKNIDIPVLLIHDKKDKDTSPQHTVNLSKILKYNKLLLTEGLGHKLISKELNREIIDFLIE